MWYIKPQKKEQSQAQQLKYKESQTKSNFCNLMQDNSLQTIGQRLKKVVSFFHGDGHGSKKVFCERIGITSAMLHSWMTGRHQPAATYRDKICEVYSVCRAWLDTGAGEMITKACDIQEVEKLKAEVQELKIRLDEAHRAFDSLLEKGGRCSSYEKNVHAGAGFSP